MAYNLPPPWSPRYALPSHVQIESTQRRAFITRQQPRGSYDAPDVTNGGYAVPEYVTAHPYGQGAQVTKWMARGTAPAAAHWISQPPARLISQTKVSGGGNNYEIGPAIESIHQSVAQGAAQPYKDYGQNVATHVLSSIATLAPVHRKTALKMVFDKIDPKLYSRVNATATRAAKAGMPVKRALHYAIATEFEHGILRELTALGTTGRVKVASQVGLGCWGCAAIGLGDVSLGAAGVVSSSQTGLVTAPTSAGRATTTPISATAAASTAASQAALAKQQAAGASTAPHWERASAGINDSDTVCGYVWVGKGVGPSPSTWPSMPTCPTTSDQRGTPSKVPVFCGFKDANGNVITSDCSIPTCGMTWQGQTLDPNYTLCTDPKTGQINVGQPAATVTVGPFTFAVNPLGNANVGGVNLLPWPQYANGRQWTKPSDLSSGEYAWLQQQVSQHLGHANDTIQGPNGNWCDRYNTLGYWFPALKASSDQSVDSDYKSADGKQLAVNPLVGNITNPVDPTKPLGVYLSIGGDGQSGCGPFTTRPQLALVLAPMSNAPKTAWGTSISNIGSVVSSIADGIGELACAALSSPVAAPAAAAASGGTAAAGAQIAKAACAQPPPAPVSTGIGTGTILLIGGVGVAAILLATHIKPRRSESAPVAAPAPRASRTSRRSSRRSTTR